MSQAPENNPRLAIARRLAALQAAYHAAFNTEFDMMTFGDDDFYAFQVLERSVRDGSPALREIATELEELLVRVVETGSTIEIFAPGEAPVRRVPVAAGGDTTVTVRLAAQTPFADAVQALSAAAVAAPAAPHAPQAAPQALHTAAPVPATNQATPAAAPAVTPAEAEASEAATFKAPGVPAAAAGADAESLARAAERRGKSGRGTGHVRLGNREIVCLSQLRVQYRRTFGVFIDIFEFTGNDLYARSLLSLCAQSQDPALVALSREFLNDDSTPRFHRRKGVADIEFALH